MSMEVDGMMSGIGKGVGRRSPDWVQGRRINAASSRVVRG